MYTIYPAGPTMPLKVYCDMDIGGGWTVSGTCTVMRIYYLITRKQESFCLNALLNLHWREIRELRVHPIFIFLEWFKKLSSYWRSFYLNVLYYTLSLFLLSQVIQRRTDGTENFYRPWSQYKAGFGNVVGEYWLGEFFRWLYMCCFHCWQVVK